MTEVSIEQFAAAHPDGDTVTTVVESPAVVAIDTPTLGDRSYLAHDGKVAVVVDPQRDIDRMLTLADQYGVVITHVVETHIHNDYVTGGLALARETGARYYVNADDDVAYERTPIHDGDVVSVSPTLQLRTIATPGHTFTHLSYALESRCEPDDDFGTVGVFTGGSLLFGTTGRPDLLGDDQADALARHQYASAHRLVGALPDETPVLPTHGFGSFCSPGAAGDATASTIGVEKRQNSALTQDEETWVSDTLASLDAYPAYYVHMTPANSAGPLAPDLTFPTVADRETIADRIRAGEWVVDLRTRSAFAAGHVHGTLNFGLDGQFATYVGWLLPWDASITLLGESAEQVSEAQLELVRIGMERFAGAATGAPSDWTRESLGSFPSASFADLAQVLHHRPVVVLDVRRAKEFEDSHVEGAVNIPIHELLDRTADVPAGEVWVHCAGGYRASIAASALAAHGRHVVAVDDSFDENAASSGLPLVAA